MSRQQFPGQSQNLSPADNPYGKWEGWAEEVFPEEGPRIDRLRASSFAYRRAQERIESRRSKGTKAVPPRIVSPEVDIVLEAEPEARRVIDDRRLDDIQEMVEF